MAVLRLEHVYKRYDNTEKKLFKKQVKNDLSIPQLNCYSKSFINFISRCICKNIKNAREWSG